MSSSPRNDRSSSPLDIPRGQVRHGRPRSASESSEASLAETPPKTTTPPRVKIQASPIATSPIMSYFFPGSPTKTPGSMFGRPPTGSVVVDDDEEIPTVLPASAHARRFSSSWAKPIPTVPPTAGPDDRGSGLLRRLSLSSAFGRPMMPGTGNSPPGTGIAAPASSPIAPKPIHAHARGRHPSPSPSPRPSPGPPGHRVRRSATIGVAPKPRAPSPMGERILKGHFDGFV